MLTNKKIQVRAMKPGHQNRLACNAGIFGGGLGAKGGGWRTLARRPSRALPTATTESVLSRTQKKLRFRTLPPWTDRTDPSDPDLQDFQP